MPKVNRLKHWRDFAAVYRQGVSYRGRYLVIKGLYGNHSPKQAIKPSKIGISISQKVSKKAVTRNRLKRQIRAMLRQLLPVIAPGWRLVIVVRPQAVECEYEHFLRELKKLLVQAEVLDGHKRDNFL